MTNDEFEKAAREAAEKFSFHFVTMSKRPPHRPDIMEYCFEAGAKWSREHLQAKYDNFMLLFNMDKHAMDDEIERLKSEIEDLKREIENYQYEMAEAFDRMGSE